MKWRGDSVWPLSAHLLMKRAVLRLSVVPTHLTTHASTRGKIVYLDIASPILSIMESSLFIDGSFGLWEFVIRIL